MKYTTLFSLCLVIIISTGCVTQTRYDNLLSKYSSLNSEKEALTQNLSSAQNERAGKIFSQQQRIEQLEKNFSLLKSQCQEKITDLAQNNRALTQDLQALHTESSANTKHLLNKNLELQEKCDTLSQKTIPYDHTKKLMD